MICNLQFIIQRITYHLEVIIQTSAHSHTHATWLGSGLNRSGGGRGITKHICLYSFRYNEIARTIEWYQIGRESG